MRVSIHTSTEYRIMDSSDLPGVQPLSEVLRQASSVPLSAGPSVGTQDAAIQEAPSALAELLPVQPTVPSDPKAHDPDLIGFSPDEYRESLLTEAFEKLRHVLGVAGVEVEHLWGEAVALVKKVV